MARSRRFTNFFAYVSKLSWSLEICTTYPNKEKTPYNTSCMSMLLAWSGLQLSLTETQNASSISTESSRRKDKLWNSMCFFVLERGCRRWRAEATHIRHEAQRRMVVPVKEASCTRKCGIAFHGGAWYNWGSGLNLLAWWEGLKASICGKAKYEAGT